MSQGPRRNVRDRQRGPLGGRVRDLRLARCLTQVELAVEVGVSRAHIAKMETGDPPGREVLHALATLFAVSMEFLQSGIFEAPKQGRFVEDAEQLALLDLWAAIPPAERPRIARMLKASAFET